MLPEYVCIIGLIKGSRTFQCLLSGQARLSRAWASYQMRKIAHVPGCRERFPPPSQVGDPDMHHGTCVTHVPWCMPGSLTSGFLWSRWRGKRSLHSRRMRNPHFHVSGKKPIVPEMMTTFMYWKTRRTMIWSTIIHGEMFNSFPSLSDVRYHCQYLKRMWRIALPKGNYLHGYATKCTSDILVR